MCPIANLDIRRFSYEPIDSSMWVICGKESAIIVDPCVSEDAWVFLQEQCCKKVTVLLTHEHYDHISGVNWLRERIPTTVICSSVCAERIQDDQKNSSRHFDVLFLLMGKDFQTKYKKNWVPYFCHADIWYDNEYKFNWEGHELIMTATPGHSLGSSCILLDNQVCFTGDSLLKNIPVITRLPGGSKISYKQTKESYIDRLPIGCVICPGHGEMFEIEKQ